MRLDQWDIQLGMDLTNYMEESIRSADYVLLVCTPTFALRANSGLGGVGYEKAVITGEIYSGAQHTKFIPILKDGDPTNSLPSYLKNKLYVDFRNDTNFDSGVLAIVRHVYQKPESDMPPLGIPEIIGRIASSHSRKSEEQISLSSMMQYARRNYPDLDITPKHIEEIVGNLKQLQYKTIDELDMVVRPVRHIARHVQCTECRRYACDQITIALALANPEYGDLLGPHQAQHTEWLRDHRPRLHSTKEGWL